MVSGVTKVMLVDVGAEFADAIQSRGLMIVPFLDIFACVLSITMLDIRCLLKQKKMNHDLTNNHRLSSLTNYTRLSFENRLTHVEMTRHWKDSKILSWLEVRIIRDGVQRQMFLDALAE